MISSKRIPLVAVILLIAAIAFIVWAGFFYTPQGTIAHTRVYGEHEISYKADDFFDANALLFPIKIELNGSSASASDSKVSISGGDIRILKGGTYVFSGTLEDGSIHVNSLDAKPVYIVLDNAHITSSDNATIYVEECVKTIIAARDATDNSLSDSGRRTDDDDAVIYSRDDLTLTGSGSISINASYADAIKCNDTLKILDADIKVTAKDEGINANSCIGMLNCKADIKSGGDAIKCEDSEDTAKGFAAFENVTMNIESEDDGIWTYGNAYFENSACTISSPYGDAIHSENKLILNPESIDITQCYEGIEGSFVTINGGKINITSSDDAINAVGAFSDGGKMHPMGMQGEVTEENTHLTINGGSIVVNTEGDGIDSNGAVVVNDGYIEVYGPQNGGNSSLDFEYGFVINGGTLLAAGSSGMAAKPHEASAQSSLVFYLDATQTGEISLKGSSGESIISGMSEKLFDWVCISTPEIKNAEQYTLYVNKQNTATLQCDSVVTTNRDQGESGEIPQGRGGMRGQIPMQGGPMPQGEMPQMPVNPQEPPANGKADADIKSDAQQWQNPRGEMNFGGRGPFGERLDEGETKNPTQKVGIKENEPFYKKYFTPILSIVLLAFAFVFVIFYKRKTY